MSPTAAPVLPPINPALGLNSSFCLPKQTTLQMREKVWSLSGDSFHIVDEAGVEVVQCRGQTFSLSDRKEFADAQGRPLFSLRNKHLSLHKSFYAETSDGKVLFEVKSKFSIGSSKMMVTFTNASNGVPIELLVKGDWFDRSAKITMGDVVVAQIARSFMNVREVFGNKQSYNVTVAPGVDLSMMAAICVCLDEKENEKK